MKKILFVSSFNICCSVMAQYMLQAMVGSIGAGRSFQIDSAATSKVHVGEEIYPEARKKLTQMHVPSGQHRARLLTWDDYDRFDYLIGMDEMNIGDIRYIVGSDPDQKISRLSSFAGSDKDIADPWYTEDFDTAYDDIQKGLMGLLNRLS